MSDRAYLDQPWVVAVAEAAAPAVLLDQAWVVAVAEEPANLLIDQAYIIVIAPPKPSRRPAVAQIIGLQEAELRPAGAPNPDAARMVAAAGRRAF
jgi:hypothetical protein